MRLQADFLSKTQLLILSVTGGCRKNTSITICSAPKSLAGLYTITEKDSSTDITETIQYLSYTASLNALEELNTYIIA